MNQPAQYRFEGFNYDAAQGHTWYGDGSFGDGFAGMAWHAPEGRTNENAPPGTGQHASFHDQAGLLLEAAGELESLFASDMAFLLAQETTGGGEGSGGA